jgi:hypothetical protein
MRTDVRAEIALNTVFRLPYREIGCNMPSLIGSAPVYGGTVRIRHESGYRKGIAFTGIDRLKYILDKVPDSR